MCESVCVRVCVCVCESVCVCVVSCGWPKKAYGRSLEPWPRNPMVNLFQGLGFSGFKMILLGWALFARKSFVKMLLERERVSELRCPAHRDLQSLRPEA